MALTEIYVDPSIAADSGTGTSGDPFGDLEYAIVQTTFDTTNGLRINIKAGTDEVLAADLLTSFNDTSVSVAWAFSETAPLYIQGYTSTAGDGGVGGISGGGGNFSLMSPGGTQRYITLCDLHLHNTGSAAILDLNNYSNVIRCELDDSTSNAIEGAVGVNVVGNYIHNIGGQGVNGLTTYIGFNYFENGANNFAATAGGGCVNGSDTVVANNIFVLDSTSDAINVGDTSIIINNSIYSNAGGGKGLYIAGTAAPSVIANNLIEGFSSAGGRAINFATSSAECRVLANNSWYDCETGIDTHPSTAVIEEGNEELTGSPFTDAANGDFSPVNIGSVKEGSWPASFNNS